MSDDLFLTQEWPWNTHLEIRGKYISEDAAQIILDILEGKPYKMPEKLVLESERAIELVNGGPDDEYEYVDSEYAGEWRWGVMYEAIIRHKASGKLWGVTYQVQTGDNYYNSLEDEARFYPVAAIEVTTIEYQRIK